METQTCASKANRSRTSEEDFAVFTGQTQLGGTDLESTQVLIGELLERSFSLGSDSEAVGAALKGDLASHQCALLLLRKKNIKPLL